jgi:AP-1 complex subunit mu
MVASAIYITDLKGKVLIARNYRGNVSMAAAEKFSQRIRSQEDKDVKPVFTVGSVTFSYIKYNNVYLLATSRRNVNVTLILLFLYRICDVFKSYFGEITEESIKDNFVIIYELLDETIDFGYPQTTEHRVLKEFIMQEGNKMAEQVRPPISLTNAVSWRGEGIVHKKNEIFLDIVEKLNLLVASNGTVLRSEIIGAVKMKSFLSGMPELKLGLNDKVMFEVTGRNYTRGKAIEMEDIKFHQCVRLAR